MKTSPVCGIKAIVILGLAPFKPNLAQLLSFYCHFQVYDLAILAYFKAYSTTREYTSQQALRDCVLLLRHDLEMKSRGVTLSETQYIRSAAFLITSRARL